MRLTDDRISYLAHHIIDSLVKEGLIKVADKAIESQEVKKLMTKFLQSEEAVDQKIRLKISTIKRGILEGSREWDILYEQYYNEEMNKLKTRRDA